MLSKINEELKSKRDILHIEWEKKKEHFYRKIIRLAEANQSLILEIEKYQGNNTQFKQKYQFNDIEELSKEISILSELILS